MIWWHTEWLIIRQRLAAAVWTGRILAQFSIHLRTWDTPSPYRSLRCSILFIYTITVTFIIGDPRIWCTGLNGTATESTKRTNSTERTSPPSQQPAWSANKQHRNHNHCSGGICPSRQSRRECKIFASGVNFSIFTHFLCFFLLKLLKLGEIDGVKFLAWKSGGVKFWTNSMSAKTLIKFYV